MPLRGALKRVPVGYREQLRLVALVLFDHHTRRNTNTERPLSINYASNISR